ncbi:hepatocyte growth factor regulated tyrosine kinase substrate isoform X4 [Oratosquilla oratoria]|uniref:hepatocyte growth factor regulated tyrosine kinase substrate isoform X4 n=1 Tax=Oratosquilla oratoria TaxID=337810 RepID=UPI003F75A059
MAMLQWYPAANNQNLSSPDYVEKATSPLLLELDWDSTIHIVDLIRQGDVNAKAATQALVTRLKDTNPNVVLLALQVFESVVKNCGQVVHEQIASRHIMEQLHEILRTNTNEEVRKKLINLLATWQYAFRNEPKYRAVQVGYDSPPTDVSKDTINIMKAEGFHFPTVSESDAMFSADRAPDWADGESCHRCRSQFTVIRRKHHCRACGQVFCGECSSKYSTIPKFGIEKEVRVCESCFDDINNPQPTPTSKVEPDPVAASPKGPKGSQVKTAGKKSEEELQEEEELQLALALSRSEAENKEKEKLRATSSLLGGNWRQPSPTPASPTPTSKDKEDMDPELARYLNRSYWEQQQQQQQQQQKEVEEPRSENVLSPTQPSAPFNAATKVTSPSKVTSPKMIERFQNGETEEVDEFVSTLRSQLEIFVNRMKSNQSRGRSIANDTAVQSLFMNITAMHSQLLKYIQQQDDQRAHLESLQDKITQVRDARAALEALREDHNERLRREREEQERQRQIQMMQKLEIMRKKKQEYLEYQRQLALHRMAESEREIFNKGGPPQNAVPPYSMGYPYPGAASMPGYMYPPQGEGGAPANSMPYQAPPPQPGVPYQPPPPPGAAPPQGPPAMPHGTMPNQQGFQPPPPAEYSPYSMTGMAGALPNIPSGMPGYVPPPGTAPVGIPPPQQGMHPPAGGMPPPMPSQQPPMGVPMPPVTCGPMDPNAQHAPPPPHIQQQQHPPPPPQTQAQSQPQPEPQTPQDQQAELISFD